MSISLLRCTQTLGGRGRKEEEEEEEES